MAGPSARSAERFASLCCHPARPEP